MRVSYQCLTPSQAVRLSQGGRECEKDRSDDVADKQDWPSYIMKCSPVYHWFNDNLTFTKVSFKTCNASVFLSSDKES